MILIAKDYIRFICEAASLPEHKATLYFIHKFNMNDFRNEFFFEELGQAKDNMYYMYKQHLYSLSKTDKRRIGEMYGDKILLKDMLIDKYSDINISPDAYYNKAVWGKINEAYTNSRQTVRRK
ncbi:MAG: hypothetical protein FJ356_06520 [Thaumarchaeota archaeon]|nr:hypothetical protein [Nitrososphaerota archaeon]